MAETQNNIALLHRKEWQTMTPPSVTNATLMFMASGNESSVRYTLYVTSATVHYLYDNLNDAWLQIPSGAFSPAIAAGACGVFSCWSPSFTATGGSTTTVTVNTATHNINGIVVGKTIEFLTGTAANVGLRRTITKIVTVGGTTGTITITFDSAVTSAVANTDTFRIASGSFFVFTSGVLASSFKRFDLATMSWGSFLSIVGLTATWGTDGRMVTPCHAGTSYDSGTAAVTSTTTQLDCTGKTWTNDQWINYQVRITGGTGKGQIRVITDNDADSLMFAAGIDLDDTSTFVIEGDENAIYLMGLTATTMFKYSISGNTWATVAPTVLRAGAPTAGVQADFIGKTGNADWANISNIQDGRYIYSFRGTTAVLDRFDISGGTNGAGAWSVITYQPAMVTLATGASSCWDGKSDIYFVKEGTTAIPQRVYKYSVVDNLASAVADDWYLGGAATSGNKIWIQSLSTAGTIKWLYLLGATVQTLRRIMLF